MGAVLVFKFVLALNLNMWFSVGGGIFNVALNACKLSYVFGCKKTNQFHGLTSCGNCKLTFTEVRT